MNGESFLGLIGCGEIVNFCKDSLKMKPQDEFNAALVLQHGTRPEHYELAHKLSSDAAIHKAESAEWLSHASWDRWQMSIGKPQKFGTQYSVDF